MGETMDYFTENPEITWLVIGALFLIAEVTIATGIGFLFAGLGAITLGGLMTFEFLSIDSLYSQLAYFLAFTSGWAALLWQPLKKIYNSNANSYDNIVGSVAVVNESPLIKGKTGTVRWSGTTMRAKIDPEVKINEIKVGQEVEVKNVKDSILIVTPTK